MGTVYLTIISEFCKTVLKQYSNIFLNSKWKFAKF